MLVNPLSDIGGCLECCLLWGFSFGAFSLAPRTEPYLSCTQAEPALTWFGLIAELKA